MSPANHALPVSKPARPLLNGQVLLRRVGGSKRFGIGEVFPFGGVMRIDLWHWAIAPPPQGELPALDDAFADVLARHELERAARLLDPREGYRFALARRGLRMILGRETACAPHDIRFEVGEHGKPALIRGETTPGDGLSFNLSHSGDLALLAVSRDGCVGVDVERVRDVDLRIARRFFTVREAEAIAAAGGQPEQLAAFFRIWTAKEAVVKATGEGILRGLDTFEFAGRADGEASVVASKPGGLPPPDARVRWFAPADGYAAAVAAIDVDGPIVMQPQVFTG